MQLSLQLSKLQGTTSYFDGNMGRVGVKSDTVLLRGYRRLYLKSDLIKNIFFRSRTTLKLRVTLKFSLFF